LTENLIVSMTTITHNIEYIKVEAILECSADGGSNTCKLNDSVLVQCQ